MCTCNNEGTVGSSVFYAVHVEATQGVEARSNTSTVTLRVVGDDEQGSLKLI
jgi:hypothetical protein